MMSRFFQLLPPLVFLAFGTFTGWADLVVHYAFDESNQSNETVVDSLGRNNGTLINASEVIREAPSHDPLFGTACEFPARSGVNLGTDSAVRPVDQFTISWWMRPDILDPFDRIYETMTGTTNEANGIRIDMGGAPGNSIRVLLRDGNGITSTTHTHSLELRNDGTWYFVAVRYDSTAGDGSALQLTVLESGGNPTARDIRAATESPRLLGTGPIDLHSNGAFLASDDANAAGANDFAGALDDFAVFQTGDVPGIISDEDLSQVSNSGALSLLPDTSPPVIEAFTTSQSTIAAGSPVVLSWSVQNAESIVLSPGFGTVDASGSRQVAPAGTTIYTLTASRENQATTASIQVTVEGQLLPPVISEFMARNRENLEDGDGNPSDWIELHNPNLTPLDLTDYSLTDDAGELARWSFPPGTIMPAGGYLVVFASQQPTDDYVDAGGNLHTNFSLNGGGEYLALVSPDAGSPVSEFFPTYPEQREDISYGPRGFYAIPTPGAPSQGRGVIDFVADTSFSIDRGFYTTPISVEITTPTAGAEIYYTTDGTEPSPQNGILYHEPVSLSETTALRAAAFKEGYEPTNVDTQTYLFLEDILRQPSGIPGYPDTWAGRPAHYQMDPDIVAHPLYGPEMEAALKAFPALSIAIDPVHMFGRAGIYQNPQSQGRSWERPVSAELISADGSEPGFQIDAGMRLQGGSSRNPDIPKHSLSLRFRRDYGSGKLRYPLFRDAPFGDTAVEEFDFLQLRAGFNFAWTHRHYYQARHAQYNRDQWVNDLYLAMGQPGTHGRWVHLYLNGLYWGLYHMHERPDGDFMASYFGGDSDDYDALSSGQPRSGDTTAWNTMVSIARGNIANPSQYAAIQDYLDIDSLIDYMLLNFFVGNTDWDGHNWRAARKREAGAGYLMLPWDSEFALSPNGPGVINNPQPLSNALNVNVTGRDGNGRPSGLHQDLSANAEYRMRFADRVQLHLFNGGALSPETAGSIWRTRSDLMDEAIIAESARWGDFRYDVDPGRWRPADFARYTRNEHYLQDQAWILRSYIPRRGAILLEQLRNQNLYPRTEAPRFRQHGGTIATGQALTISNPNPAGVVYFTLDGSDPRDPTRRPNGISASAIRYIRPPVFTESAQLRARVLNGTEWSAINQATFLAGNLAEPSNLTVSELMYNPPGPSENLEFIELVNLSGTETIELGGSVFSTGIQFSFPINTLLPPGARLLLVSDEEAFASRYGEGLPVVGQYDGLLDNGGEQIVILDAAGNVILDFTYDDGRQWPAGADGGGRSLVNRGPDMNDALSWRDSDLLMGSPGERDNPEFSGIPSADDDGDGIQALLEYATGGNELSPDSIWASPSISQSSDGHLEILINVNMRASDIDLTLEKTLDLQSWEPLSGFRRIAIERDPSQGSARVIYRATSPTTQGASTQFLRLRASRR